MGDIATCLRETQPQAAALYTAETLRLLEDAYNEPQRSYHGTGHIIDLLQKLAHYNDAARRPELIAHAILWHDAVYRTWEETADGKIVPRSDAVNVEDSARLFENAGPPLSDDARATVAHMIRATAGHDVRLPKDHPDYNDTALFLDLDLSVLALPYDAFVQKTAQIRQEYPHVSDADFRVGRALFMDEYRTKAELFFHPVTTTVYDAQARENMARASVDLRQRAAAE